MRTLKIVLWILAIYIIENLFGGALAVGGATADFLIAFSVAYSFFERKLSKLIYIIIICAILNGAGVGRVFPIATAVTGIGALIGYSFYNYLRMIPAFLRVSILSAATAFVASCAEIFVSYKTLFVSSVWTVAVVHGVYTGVVACIIYALLFRTLFKNRDKRLLTIQERI